MLTNTDNELMCRVGPGTPMGEVLREYWLPVFFPSELEADGPPLRTRLLGPLATLATNSTAHRQPLHRNSVEAAFHDVDTALDHLCSTLGLQQAA